MFSSPIFAAEPQLAIIDAGVEPSEDAPFVSADYHFLPGDYVYFTFQIVGFKINSEERDEVHKIALKYQIEPADANGVPLAESVSGGILTDLSAEDKNWLPKRRVSFLLPSFIAAGQYHVHAAVKDVFGKTEASADFPFQVGGEKVQSSPTLTVENFEFLRKEDDREALKVPAYSAGDTIYARFDMAGYKLGSRNAYQLSYGLTVLRPDGKPYFQNENAAQLRSDSFYPAQFVPGTINLITSLGSARGEYVIILTVHDLVGNQNYELKRAFSIE